MLLGSKTIEALWNWEGMPLNMLNTIVEAIWRGFGVISPLVLSLLFCCSSNEASDSPPSMTSEERASFEEWRAQEYPGEAGEHSNGCTFRDLDKVDSDSVVAQVAILLHDEPLSGEVIFESVGSGWRCDSGTFHTSQKREVSACSSLSILCTKSKSASSDQGKTPIAEPDYSEPENSPKPPLAYDKTIVSCLGWGRYTSRRLTECELDVSYKVNDLCNDDQDRAMAHGEFKAKTCKALARAMKKRDREVTKRVESQQKVERGRVAAVIDSMMIKLGMEGSARARGKTLVIEYALCGRVFHDRMINGNAIFPAGQMRPILKDAGFTRLKCSDGYEVTSGDL